MMCC